VKPDNYEVGIYFQGKPIGPFPLKNIKGYLKSPNKDIVYKINYEI
jgi:hypothetical protein